MANDSTITTSMFFAEPAVIARPHYVSLPAIYRCYSCFHLASFASSKAQALPAEARREISRQFRVPEYLFSEVCQQLNGYFWSGVVDDENEHLKRRSMYNVIF